MHDLKPLMLVEPRWTLSLAESLTCGRLQATVGAISGASEFFVGGITAYTLEQKVRHLGVDRAVAEPVDCVSEEVARQMALGACRLFGSDAAAATTGYAEPAPAFGVRTPFAWWAVVIRQTVVSGRLEVSGKSRVDVQRTVAEAVLGQLVESLRRARQAG